jgi:hypothetical protein
VLGRADDQIKFYNTMLRTGEILAAVRGIDGVDDAQLALEADPGDGSAARAIRIRYVGARRDPAGIRAAMLRELRALESITRHAPGSVRVEWAPALERNGRTDKVTPSAWDTV